MLTKNQLLLTLHALALPLVMALIVPTLTGWNPQLGYLLSLVVYWLIFCIPVIAWHVWNRHDGRLFSERLRWGDWWIVPLLLAQVTTVGIVAFFPNTELLTTHGAMLAGAVALLNGPLEEAAWRGGFMARFSDRPRLGFWLGWVLFSLWHVPLLLSQGIVFDGGAMSLLGGAAGLGLLWSWVAWRTGSVFYTAIAHTLTNVLTFWVLFNSNGFVAPHP